MLNLNMAMASSAAGGSAQQHSHTATSAADMILPNINLLDPTLAAELRVLPADVQRKLLQEAQQAIHNQQQQSLAQQLLTPNSMTSVPSSATHQQQRNSLNTFSLPPNSLLGNANAANSSSATGADNATNGRTMSTDFNGNGNNGNSTVRNLPPPSNNTFPPLPLDPGLLQTLHSVNPALAAQLLQKQPAQLPLQQQRSDPVIGLNNIQMPGSVQRRTSAHSLQQQQQTTNANNAQSSLAAQLLGGGAASLDHPAVLNAQHQLLNNLPLQLPSNNSLFNNTQQNRTSADAALRLRSELNDLIERMDQTSKLFYTLQRLFVDRICTLSALTAQTSANDPRGSGGSVAESLSNNNYPAASLPTQRSGSGSLTSTPAPSTDLRRLQQHHQQMMQQHQSNAPNFLSTSALQQARPRLPVPAVAPANLPIPANSLPFNPTTGVPNTLPGTPFTEADIRTLLTQLQQSNPSAVDDLLTNPASLAQLLANMNALNPSSSMPHQSPTSPAKLPFNAINSQPPFAFQQQQQGMGELGNIVQELNHQHFPNAVPATALNGQPPAPAAKPKQERKKRAPKNANNANATSMTPPKARRTASVGQNTATTAASSHASVSEDSPHMQANDNAVSNNNINSSASQALENHMPNSTHTTSDPSSNSLSLHDSADEYLAPNIGRLDTHTDVNNSNSIKQELLNGIDSMRNAPQAAMDDTMLTSDRIQTDGALANDQVKKFNFNGINGGEQHHGEGNDDDGYSLEDGNSSDDDAHGEDDESDESFRAGSRRKRGASNNNAAARRGRRRVAA